MNNLDVQLSNLSFEPCRCHRCMCPEGSSKTCKAKPRRRPLVSRVSVAAAAVFFTPTRGNLPCALPACPPISVTGGPQHPWPLAVSDGLCSGRARAGRPPSRVLSPAFVSSSPLPLTRTSAEQRPPLQPRAVCREQGGGGFPSSCSRLLGIFISSRSPCSLL